MEEELEFIQAIFPIEFIQKIKKFNSEYRERTIFKMYNIVEKEKYGTMSEKDKFHIKTLLFTFFRNYQIESAINEINLYLSSLPLIVNLKIPNDIVTSTNPIFDEIKYYCFEYPDDMSDILLNIDYEFCFMYEFLKYCLVNKPSLINKIKKNNDHDLIMIYDYLDNEKEFRSLIENNVIDIMEYRLFKNYRDVFIDIVINSTKDIYKIPLGLLTKSHWLYLKLKRFT